MPRIARRPLSLIVLLPLLLVLSGCITSRNLPPGPIATMPAPPVLQSRSAMVNSPGAFDKGQIIPSAKAEIGSWFASPMDGSADYEVTVTEQVKMGGDFIATLICPYLCTLGILPVWGTETHTSQMVVKSRGQEVFRSTQQTRVRQALSIYTPAALMFGKLGSGGRRDGVDYLTSAHRAALAQRVDAERMAFTAAVQQGTTESFATYLNSYPQSFFRGEALRGLSMLAERSHAPLEAHRRHLALYPDYGRYLSGVDGLWFVGPVGMQVVDIGPALEKGTSPELLAAQIRAARQPYRIFSADDLGWLKEKGIPDSVVAAMLDATTAAGNTMAMATPAANVQAAVPPPAAPAPAGLFGAMLAPTGAAPQQQQPPATVGAAVTQAVGQVAAECAKKYASMKLCEQMPGFGASICKAQVNKKYTNIVCAGIQ